MTDQSLLRRNQLRGSVVLNSFGSSGAPSFAIAPTPREAERNLSQDLIAPRRACILGASLDVGNRGVRALGVSVAHLVSRGNPTVDVVFLYGNSAGGSRPLPREVGTLHVTVRNCRMSPKSSLSEHIVVILGLALLYRLGIRGPARRNPWLQSLLTADLVGDIRGGDSFSDIYGLTRFVLGCLPLISVALLGRPYTMLPQTYGPFRLGISRRLAQVLLRRAHTLLTRDRNCEEIVTFALWKDPNFLPGRSVHARRQQAQERSVHAARSGACQQQLRRRCQCEWPTLRRRLHRSEHVRSAMQLPPTHRAFG